MSLQQQLDTDFKQALKNKEVNKVGVLRMLKSAIKNKSLELKKDLEDADIIMILKSEVKKRKDSIEAFKSGQRQDLIEKEEQEIEILDKYLPQQLDLEQIKQKVIEARKSLAPENQDNFGQVMKATMIACGGLADGQQVSQVVKQVLSEN